MKEYVSACLFITADAIGKWIRASSIDMPGRELAHRRQKLRKHDVTKRNNRIGTALACAGIWHNFLNL